MLYPLKLQSSELNWVKTCHSLTAQEPHFTDDIFKYDDFNLKPDKNNAYSPNLNLVSLQNTYALQL